MAAGAAGAWAIAFVITLYLSVAMPDSVGQLGALVLAYVLLAGALFSSLSLICLTLLDGPHRTRALDILHRRALPPLWLIGSLAALGDSLHDPEIMSVFGPGVSQFAGLLANVTAALLSALFVLRFRRPITHLIRNQPRERAHAPRPAGAAAADRTTVVRAVPAAGGHLAGQHGGGRRRQRPGHAPGPAVRAGGDRGHGRRRRHPPRLCARRPRRQPAHGLPGQLRYFGYTLLYIANLLLFVEIGLRVLGMSLAGLMEGGGSQFGPRAASFVGTMLVAWLIWILTDTALQHALGTSGKNRANVRALTMLPLIRNTIMATIAVIAIIVALANMGMNVTPLLAGAGVIGLAIGFGAQSLVTDLITGLFIIIENSLSIDDYVDVGNHLGTVEGLTIRTVRLRDLDGVVHTIPFSQIKTIKNYCASSATPCSAGRCRPPC